MGTTIYIDSDHNGYELKQQLMTYLRHGHYDAVDVGPLERDPNDDYPLVSSRVVAAMRGDHGKEVFGIVICGSGQGVCMAANRFRGIRAALCWDNREAKAARNDDDANVLCLAAHMVSESSAKSICHTFVTTPFAGAPRYKRRIQQLDELQ